MRLTRHTDYALRVLMYVGASPTGAATIAEVADRYGISRNHLMKIVHGLGRAGILRTVRGRAGGVHLARPAGAIRIGDVVRITEEDLAVVECFEGGPSHCPIVAGCRLAGILDEALRAFLAVLDRYTLADLLARPSAFEPLFAVDQPAV